MIFYFTQVKCILTEHQVVVIFEHCEFMWNILCFSFVEKMYITNSNIMCQCICNTRKQHALHKNAAACLAAQCLSVDGPHMLNNASFSPWTEQVLQKKYAF